MKTISKNNAVRLLVAVVTALCILVSIVTFSNDVRVPTWADIFGIKSADEDLDYVRFFDVGQGDSILISSNGRYAIIDFANDKEGTEQLMGALRKYGVKELDCMLISHFDSDHIGGADEVIERLKVNSIVMPQLLSDGAKLPAEELQRAVERTDIAAYEAKVGTVVNIGDFEITVAAYYKDRDNSNDRSLVIMAKIGDKKFLFTGDISQSVEERLIQDGYNLDCDVYKVAHHGSKYSSSSRFLKHISPQISVISCGKNNNYGHPSDLVLERLQEVSSRAYRTDECGDITVYVNEGRLQVKTER